jgi:hypothetical protein
MKKYVLLLSLLTTTYTNAQQGNLSGDLMTTVNFFQRDTNIKASDNPLYDNFLSGGEAWLGLRYAGNGFTANVRFDGFHNSNLLNPTSALTAAGIGMFSLSKEIKDLTITAGHIYDQIGSGILFRAYEDRGLLIDNAIFGLHLKYKPTQNITLKGFTGQVKNVFERYKPILKGFAAEGEVDLGSTAHATPGVGIINRTLDQDNMNLIVSIVNSYPLEKRFKPKYNSYSASVYNTLNIGDFTWYVEGAYKTEEAVATNNGLENVTGNVLYSTLGYSHGKIGINATVRRSENFMQRTSPNEQLIRGLYNWQPIIAQIRPQRLIARYTPPSQDLSEIGGNINFFIAPNDYTTLNAAYTHINNLKGDLLYSAPLARDRVATLKQMDHSFRSTIPDL